MKKDGFCHPFSFWWLPTLFCGLVLSIYYGIDKTALPSFIKYYVTQISWVEIIDAKLSYSVARVGVCQSFSIIKLEFTCIANDTMAYAIKMFFNSLRRHRPCKIWNSCILPRYQWKRGLMASSVNCDFYCVGWIIHPFEFSSWPSVAGCQQNWHNAKGNDYCSFHIGYVWC